MRLDAGRSLRLQDARGVAIRAARGVLWVTQEGDSRDHVVGLLERFVIDHDGLTMVSAVTQAEVRLERPGGVPAARDEAPRQVLPVHAFRPRPA